MEETRIVHNPWTTQYKGSKPLYYVHNVIFNKDEFFISELPDYSYLYYFKYNNEYYAFNNLEGYKEEYITLIQKELNGIKSDNWLVERGIETINNWKKELI